MVFWRNHYRPPLIEAVIQNDIEAVKKLADDSAQTTAVDSLGFNAEEIAKYLDRTECLSLLSPQKAPKIHLRKAGNGRPSFITPKEFWEYLGVKYSKFLTFSSYRLFGKVVKNCPSIFLQESPLAQKITPGKLSAYEDKPEIFTLRMHVYRQNITRGYLAPVSIEWIDDTLKYGLFAGVNLIKGEYVGEFVGEVRPCGFFKMENEYCMQYPASGWKTYVIDNKDLGNETRFINHSFDPNLEIKAASEKGLLHTLLFAKKNVTKGTQLTINYGEDYWSSREPPQEI